MDNGLFSAAPSSLLFLIEELIVQRSIDYAGTGERIQAFYGALHKSTAKWIWRPSSSHFSGLGIATLNVSWLLPECFDLKDFTFAGAFSQSLSCLTAGRLLS